jgi:hypothetical protein
MRYCCICQSRCAPFLTPSRCLRENGLEKSHKICEECWFRDFAKEGIDHICPGCNQFGSIITSSPN